MGSGGGADRGCSGSRERVSASFLESFGSQGFLMAGSGKFRGLRVQRARNSTQNASLILRDLCLPRIPAFVVGMLASSVEISGERSERERVASGRSKLAHLNEQKDEAEVPTLRAGTSGTIFFSSEFGVWNGFCLKTRSRSSDMLGASETSQFHRFDARYKFSLDQTPHPARRKERALMLFRNRRP